MRIASMESQSQKFALRMTIAYFSSGLIALLVASAGLAMSWPLAWILITVLVAWLVVGLPLLFTVRRFPNWLAYTLMVIYPALGLVAVFVASLNAGSSIAESQLRAEKADLEKTLKKLQQDLNDKSDKLDAAIASASANVETSANQLKDSRSKVDELTKSEGDQKAALVKLKAEYGKVVQIAEQRGSDVGILKELVIDLRKQLNAALVAADQAVKLADALETQLRQCQNLKSGDQTVTSKSDPKRDEPISPVLQILLPVIGPVLAALFNKTEYREKVLPAAEAIKDGKPVTKEELTRLINEQPDATTKLLTLRLLKTVAEKYGNTDAAASLNGIELELNLQEGYKVGLSDQLRKIFDRLAAEPKPSLADITNLLTDGKYRNSPDKDKVKEMLLGLFPESQSLWEAGLRDIPVISQ